MTTPIASPVEININAPLVRTFNVTVPADLTQILFAKGLLPGVINVTDQTGDWNAVGDSRRVHMTDGSSATETLTAYKENAGLAYRIDDFKGPLKFLISHSTGEWRFTPKSDATTHVSWTFTFHPKSALTAPIVRLIAKQLWPGYAGAALERVKSLAEAESSAT